MQNMWGKKEYLEMKREFFPWHSGNNIKMPPLLNLNPQFKVFYGILTYAIFSESFLGIPLIVKEKLP